MSISVFYMANCPLPFEANPLLDTDIVCDYCERLLSVLLDGERFESTVGEDLARAVFHVHTCLTKRMEFVRQSCSDMPLDAILTFEGTPFVIPEVIRILVTLAKLSKASIHGPFCFPGRVLISFFVVEKTRYIQTRIIVYRRPLLRRNTKHRNIFRCQFICNIIH